MIVGGLILKEEKEYSDLQEEKCVFQLFFLVIHAPTKLFGNPEPLDSSKWKAK